MQNWMKRFAAGAVLGMGAILPGVSGGILAVSMGIYRQMIDALAGFFRAMRKNALYLAPILAGAAIGAFGLSFGVEWLMEHVRIYVLFLFMGLVAGGAPSVIREANAAGFRPTHLLFAGAGAALVCLLLLVEGRAPLSALPLPVYLAAGAILAAGAVIPGVSGSATLILLGWYDAVLGALTRIDLPALLCLALGFAGTAVLLLKLVKLLFDRYPAQAGYSVLGFLAGTIVLMFPAVPLDGRLFAYLAVFILGFAAAWAFGRSPAHGREA